MPSPSARALLPLAVLVVLGGCLGTAGVGPSPSPTAVASPTPATDGCPNWVSFYGLDDPHVVGWAPDRVVVGYTVPADTSVLLVAFDGGAVVGTAHVSTVGNDYGVTADGDGIDLDEPLDGPHTIRVRAFVDSNDNDRFDRGTDVPCRADDEPIAAGPRSIDFGAFPTATNGSSTTATGA